MEDASPVDLKPTPTGVNADVMDLGMPRDGASWQPLDTSQAPATDDTGIKFAEARMKVLSEQMAQLGFNHSSIDVSHPPMAAVQKQMQGAYKVAQLPKPAITANTTIVINYSTVREAREMEKVGLSYGGRPIDAATDWKSFLAAFGFGAGVLLTVMLCFSCCRSRLMLCYSYNSFIQDVPFPASSSFFGWISDSGRLTTDDVKDFAGLDDAMFLRFTVMCTRLFAGISLMTIILNGILHGLYANGKDDSEYLLNMDDLEPGHWWIFWLQSVVTCLVIGGACYLIMREMYDFLPYRFLWLQTMPPPRCNTVLVENLPDELKSSTQVNKFFTQMLQKPGAVHEVSMVLYTGPLAKHYEDLKYWQSVLADANERARRDGRRPQLRISKTTVVDEIDHWEYQVADLTKTCSEERSQILKIQDARGGPQPNPVVSCSAFVTFKTAQDAQVAKCMVYGPNVDITVSHPPDPSDVLYHDLLMTDPHKTHFTIIGLALLAALFLFYLPTVTAIATLANAKNFEKLDPDFFSFMGRHEWMETTYNGLFQSITLTMFLLLLPTIISLICSTFFMQTSGAYAQFQLQRWYFFFLVVFGIVLNCLGDNIFYSIADLAFNPSFVISWVADNIGVASSFYLRYIPIQWGHLSLTSIRFTNMCRFLYYRRKNNPKLTRQLSEPEDQDLYGIGCRSAFLAYIAVIGLIFCQICPLVGVLACVTFGFCRIMYGYLMVFSEDRKPDLGGEYFVRQLHQIFLGLFIFVFAMIGYFKHRANNTGPATVAAGALLFLTIVYVRYFLGVQWVLLPAEDLRAMGKTQRRQSSRNTYMQPELEEVKNFSFSGSRK